jgi:hypothetical protein
MRYSLESNFSANSNLYSKPLSPMNQGTQGHRATKKTEGRKSRDNVPLNTLTNVK